MDFGEHRAGPCFPKRECPVDAFVCAACGRRINAAQARCKACGGTVVASSEFPPWSVRGAHYTLGATDRARKREWATGVFVPFASIVGLPALAVLWRVLAMGVSVDAALRELWYDPELAYELGGLVACGLGILLLLACMAVLALAEQRDQNVRRARAFNGAPVRAFEQESVVPFECASGRVRLAGTVRVLQHTVTHRGVPCAAFEVRDLGPREGAWRSYARGGVFALEDERGRRIVVHGEFLRVAGSGEQSELTVEDGAQVELLGEVTGFVGGAEPSVGFRDLASQQASEMRGTPEDPILLRLVPRRREGVRAEAPQGGLARSGAPGPASSGRRASDLDVLEVPPHELVGVEVRRVRGQPLG